MADIKVETGNSSRSTRMPPKKDTPPKIAISGNRKNDRIDAVDGIFQLAGMGCIMVGQLADAGALDMHGHDVSVELAELAEKNETIGKGIDTLLQVGPYAGLVTALMPLVLQLLANHKVVPPEKLSSANVVMPEVLESQVKTALTKQALDALRQQQQMEDELRQMQAEMAQQNGQPDSND
jgi:hypothetical protein